VKVSGISTGFPVLSQSSGQVAHVLLTRSPLDLHRCKHQLDLVRLACIRHAASVRPEPGSNSPSRLPVGVRERNLHREIRESTQNGSPVSTATRPTRERAAFCNLLLTVDISGFATEMPPALAFGSHSSVFKEQRGTKSLVTETEVHPPGTTRRSFPTGQSSSKTTSIERTNDTSGILRARQPDSAQRFGVPRPIRRPSTLAQRPHDSQPGVWPNARWSRCRTVISKRWTSQATTTMTTAPARIGKIRNLAPWEVGTKTTSKAVAKAGG
jgi:hypothetical protein